MDPSDKEIPLDVALKIMNDQAHYEVRRNVCLAVALYFGMASNGFHSFSSSVCLGFYRWDVRIEIDTSYVIKSMWSYF
jgi:hypothetical protein